MFSVACTYCMLYAVRCVRGTVHGQLRQVPGGTGAYSESQGIAFIRQSERTIFHSKAKKN
jgi:hypothetical protein